MTAQDLGTGQPATPQPGQQPAPEAGAPTAPTPAEAAPAAPTAPTAPAAPQVPNPPSPQDMAAPEAAPRVDAPGEGATGAPPAGPAEVAHDGSPQPVDFAPLPAESAPQAGQNLDLLMDVTVALSVELGGVEVPLSQILGLGPDSVVKLDRAVGEPVDILINRELVGRGEVVVVDDMLGVRVTELHQTPSNNRSGSER